MKRVLKSFGATFWQVEVFTPVQPGLRLTNGAQSFWQTLDNHFYACVCVCSFAVLKFCSFYFFFLVQLSPHKDVTEH